MGSGTFGIAADRATSGRFGFGWRPRAACHTRVGCTTPIDAVRTAHHAGHGFRQRPMGCQDVRMDERAVTARPAARRADRRRTAARDRLPPSDARGVASPRPTGRTRSSCSRGRRPRERPSWSRCAMGGWRCRRSPSTAAPPCRWRPTSRPRPTSGILVQLCGDAHLSNFGLYASPERAEVFDINDFDETLQGPFEWDLEAARGEPRRGRPDRVASRRSDGRHAVHRAMRSYRERMAGTRRCGRSTSTTRRSPSRRSSTYVDKRARPMIEAAVHSASHHDSIHELPKLTAIVDGKRRIVDRPPVDPPPRRRRRTRS